MKRLLVMDTSANVAIGVPPFSHKIEDRLEVKTSDDKAIALTEKQSSLDAISEMVDSLSASKVK